MSPRKSRKASSADASEPPSPQAAPVIFAYHDYVAFLRDWLAYLKASQPRFSMRELARASGLASGYLPMVMSGKRPLTGKALAKLMPHLGLDASAQSFLENLIVLGTSDSHEAREAALDRMRRFQQYQKHSRREAEVYRYLTHWYYVAIREMAALPGFKLDPEWIQEHLRVSVPLGEIRAAIDFLLANGYLERLPGGGVRPPEKALECVGGVYRVALSAYHRELLELAARSIEGVPREQRQLVGHTFALSAERYAAARAIVDDAIAKVRALGEVESQADSIYHLELALFPLTRSGAGGGDERKE